MSRRLLMILAAVLALGLAAPAGAADGGAEADRELGFQLLQMRGHLAVAQELLAAGRRDMAAMHFAHPRAEIYDDVAPALKERRVKPFGRELQALADAASGKASADEVRAELKRVEASIDTAWDTIAASRRKDAGFLASLASDTLYAAAGEYGQAVENGHFSEVAEYQDGHGFTLAVRDLWQRAGAAAGADDHALAARVEATLATFERAMPTPLPPAAPVVTPDALKQAAGDLAAAVQAAR